MVIHSGDVSVVVQGAIDKENTPKCLENIRKYFPDAEIILSTWEGANVEGLDYDKVIFNKDPGATVCSPDGTVNNVNREIISTKNGILKSSNKYVLKIRSDLILQSNRLIKINLDKYKRTIDYNYFERRIIVCSIYSRYFSINKQNEKVPMLFHPSDWMYFGLRADLFSLFNISLTQEPSFSQWFKNRPHTRNGYTDTHPNRFWKFSPEAYILTQYLREQHNIQVLDKLDITPKMIKMSEHILVNNFYMADQRQLKLSMPKYNIRQVLMPQKDREGLYSTRYWHEQYQKYCDISHKIPLTSTYLLNKIVDTFRISRRKR